MGVVKGCFVCGQDHRDNTRHSKEELNEAVKKLKEKYPLALLIVEDLATVVDLVMEETREEDVEDTRWVEYEMDEEYGDISYIKKEWATKGEHSLRDNSFFMGVLMKATLQPLCKPSIES